MPQFPADTSTIPPNTQFVRRVFQEEYLTDGKPRFKGFMFREIGSHVQSERKVPTDTYIPGATYSPTPDQLVYDGIKNPKDLLV